MGYTALYLNQTKPPGVGPARPETISLFVLASLALILIRSTCALFVAVGFFCLTFLLSSGAGAGLLLRRMAAPAAIALVILLVQAVSRGGVAIWRLRFAGFTVYVYREGILAGAMILGRVLSASLLLVFLSLNVPVQDFLALLRKLRVPGFLVALTLMVYRFSFLVLEEATKTRQAQQVRLGYAGFRNGMRSASLLGSSLILRVQDRSERVYEAARIRGVGASFPLPPSRKWSAHELREALLFALALGTFAVAGWMVHA